MCLKKYKITEEKEKTRKQKWLPSHILTIQCQTWNVVT